MKRFLARRADKIIGVLSGFDRLVFRGTLLPLVIERGLHTFLGRAGVLLLDFKRYRLTQRGHLLCAALFAARQATVAQLLGKAA